MYFVFNIRIYSKKVGKIIHRGVISYVVGCIQIYRGADKSLARPGMKQATATEDFEFHISYL